MFKNILSYLLVLGILNVPKDLYTQTYARNGMVASDHHLASEVGVEILKQGGNAIDAAVATAFALSVTHPAAGNIGGGGFLIYMNAEGTSTTIDFREKAPLAASPTMFLNERGELPNDTNLYGRPTGAHHVGVRSVGVPGTVAGLYLAHQKYGSLAWKDLVQPAVDLASNGFPLSLPLSRAAQFYHEYSPEEFMQHYFEDENGALVAFGEMWKQPALTNTLSLIRDGGHDGFYRGEVAEEIEKFMKEQNGLITREDLAKYQAIERAPVHGTYKGYDIYSMPPPSSGGVALIEMMNMMEQAGLDTIEMNSAEYIHLLAEVMRRAYADRAEFLGDPDFNPELPINQLTSKDFAKKRFSSIDFQQASASDSSRFGQIYDGENTTHLSVLDQAGNAVSLTYTLEHSYGSGTGSSKLGFIFNNEMGDFNPIPGHTDSRGHIGTDPNLIAAEKRMLSSMTPTIIGKDGQPYLVIGSPGGRTIINTVFQTVIGVLEYEQRVDQSIEALKIHHQWLPDRILYEENKMSPDTRDILLEMNHNLVPREALGVLMGIQRDIENNIYIGASDSRSPDGAAVGY